MTKTGKIIKEAISVKDLSRVYRKAVKPRLGPAYTDPASEQFLAGQGFYTTYPKKYNAARFDKIIDGSIAPPRTAAGHGRLTKPLAESSKEMMATLPDAMTNTIFEREPGERFRQVLTGSGIPNSLGDRRQRALLTRIQGIHELDELKLVPKARRALKKNVDTMTPTQHIDPDVLLREHNILSSLSGASSKTKADIINTHRNMRALNRASDIKKKLFTREPYLAPSSKSDLEALDSVLAPFGGYGTGQRINRRMRKHLSEKMLKEY